MSANSTTLILGSLPSVQSVEKREYYGNRQNAFWRIMGELFGASPDIDYEQRTKILSAQGVAVWDVLQSSVRPGSLDAHIDSSSAVSNDFAAFFRSYCHIKSVFFNGQAAERLFKKFVLKSVLVEFPDIKFEALPSTSPAHAAMTYADKLERWRAVRQSISAETKN